MTAAKTAPGLSKSLQSGRSFVMRNSKSSTLAGRKREGLTWHHAWVLLRRLCVVAAAVVYIQTSLHACFDSLRLLRDADVPSVNTLLYESALVGQYAGTTTIRESPIVAALGHDTTPRASGSLFLEATATSFHGCTSVSESSIYQDEFQRKMFVSMRDSLAYNLTYLDPLESDLIMPVIDCSFTSLVYADNTAPRFFYLMRSVQDPNDIFLFVVNMCMQEYYVAQQRATGATSVATVAHVHDMRATTIEHTFALALGYPFREPRFQVYTYYGVTDNGSWLLKSVPANLVSEASKIVSTASPTGFYISSPNEQASIAYLTWALLQDPFTMLSRWEWVGLVSVRDSWAWVHFLHLYFALSAVFGLVVLVALVYYNARAGKIWIGDAFVAISSPHWLRSALVLVSWRMGEYWALLEFALFTGNLLEQSRSTFAYASIMRADLLSLYITVVSLMGEVFRERIDPAVTLACFFVGFEARLDITQLFPAMTQTLVDFANYEFLLAIMPLDPSIPEITPLRVWNSKSLPSASALVVFATLFPIFSTLVFVVAYVVARKLYRRFAPDLAAQHQHHHHRSNRSNARTLDHSNSSAQSSLTQFEFASGVALRDRFGVVSDYDNYVHLKGMTFASADGIYTSGFVIANGMFLIAIDDLKAILLIKLTHIRFKNVYIYDVDGNSIKQTARLVYPSTLSFRDLIQLNLKVLL